MNVRQANNIVYNAKASLAVEGYKIPAALETDGVRLLLDGHGYDGYVRGLARSPYAEAGTVFTRLVEICADAHAAFDVDLLCAIHRKLFSAVDPNAGRLRTVNTSRQGGSFPDYRYIAGSLKRLFAKLNAAKSDVMLSRGEFCSVLTHYYTETYLLAPFTRGNGVTVRTFFWLYARANGFALDFFKVAPRAFADAENRAFAADDVTALYTCFARTVSYFNGQFALPPHVKPIAPAPAKRKPKPEKKAEAAKQTPLTLDDLAPSVKADLIAQIKAELLTSLEEEVSKKILTDLSEKAASTSDDAYTQTRPSVFDTEKQEPPAESITPLAHTSPITVDPPIERTPVTRAVLRRRTRADKLKQKISKLRQNLEDLLDDE